MTEHHLNTIARWLGPALLLVLIGGYVVAFCAASAVLGLGIDWLVHVSGGGR